jgi:Leucine-rich repeat (LRR) protein
VKRILLPFLCLFVLFQSHIFGQNRMQDSIALRALYNATDGPHWTNNSNWLTGNLSTWYGVTLNSTTQRVNRISLPNNGLTGKLPSVVGTLTGLRWLYLNGNSLMDTLPKSLGNLALLITLNIEDNILRGDLPDLSAMSSLEELYLKNNYLAFSNLEMLGIIPGDIEIFEYTPQDTIPSLSYNINNGTITVEITDGQDNTYNWLKNSTPISVATRTIMPPGEGFYNCHITNSNFPGLTLDSEILNFLYSHKSDSLALVALYYATNGSGWSNHTNWLTGKLDTWYGVILDGAQRVSKIKLNGNQLEGTLPPEMANLSQLISLKINNNRLNGNLPLFERTETIDTIWVNNNKYDFVNFYTAQISPSSINSFIYDPQDTLPSLNFNQYDVTLTVGVGTNVNNSFQWYLDGSPIGGSLQTIVVGEEGLFNCEVTNSVFSDLTLFSDTIDISFTLASDSIALVHLYNETDGPHWTTRTNWLTGRVSSWYGVKVTGNRVSHLLLPRNKLTGTIPNEIGNLTHLVQFNLSNNQLSGQIPSEIEKLINLTILKLYSNQLSGNIPVGITSLVNLTELGLHFNLLTGDIPTGIVDLTELQSLKLSNNQLTGTIPVGIDNLDKLTWLALNDNKLTGTIPVAIGNMTLLEGIELDGNSFSGTIPVEIGNLTVLTQLSLDDNDLTGGIPVVIGGLTRLSILSLSGNQLTGTFPSALTNLTELTDLFLNNNKLTGTIPTGIGFLTSLNNLNLAKNKFSGSLPSEIENLTELISFNIDSNQFVGDLPLLSPATYLSEFTVDNNHFTFSNLASSDVLPIDIDQFIYTPQDTIFALNYNLIASTLTVTDDDESENEFTWFRGADQLAATTKTIPLTREGNYYCTVGNPQYPELTIYSDTFQYSYTLLTDSVALVALYDSTGGTGWSTKTNWLSGRLSTWYGVTLSGGRVSKVILNNNNLIGKLPSDIGKLTQLTELQLQTNSLTGKLPSEFSDLIKLTDLRLNNNQLSGTIPVGIGDFAGLKTLYLNNNQFSGSFPTELGDLSQLTYLSINSNQLSGVIPPEIGNLTLLKTLNLNMNQLSGNLPSEIGLLSSLQYLYLSNNLLSGTLPTTIGDLTSAKNINLSGNNFEGTLPSEIGDLENVLVLNFSGNNFASTIPSDFSYLSSLTEFNIGNNAFQFIDIEPVFGWANYPGFNSSFTYTPQAKIGVVQTIKGYIGSPLSIQIEDYITAEHDVFKWYKNNVLLTGKTDPVLVIPAYSESNSGTYHCVVTNSLATLLTLTSNDILVETYTVPETFSLTNQSVGNGESVCYNALQTITVAGSGTTVNLLSGSSSTFIAGQSVRFLPGFHAQSGSYMDAQITTTASFCEPPVLIMAPGEIPEKSVINGDVHDQDKADIIEKMVKVFPNPNNGIFAVELSNFEKPVQISVVNMMGATIYPSQIIGSGLYELNLSGIVKGLYFVRIEDGETHLSKKIVVQ